MKFATKPYDTIHLNLGMLLHYLGKLKIQIFCRYSTLVLRSLIVNVPTGKFRPWASYLHLCASITEQ